MSFMEAQITDKQWWLLIDGPCGVEALPENDLSDYTENHEAYSAELVHGYGVRSSAPEYLDCTPWAVYTNKREAMRAYRDEQRECD